MRGGQRDITIGSARWAKDHDIKFCFVEPGSRVALESDYMDKELRLLRIFLPVGIVRFVVFIPWDFMMAPDVAPTTFINRMRLCPAPEHLREFWDSGKRPRFFASMC